MYASAWLKQFEPCTFSIIINHLFAFYNYYSSWRWEHIKAQRNPKQLDCDKTTAEILFHYMWMKLTEIYAHLKLNTYILISQFDFFYVKGKNTRTTNETLKALW